MKKHFINFLKAFCAYDEFLEGVERNFIFQGFSFDIHYFLAWTEPERFITDAFSSSQSPFSRDEFFNLYDQWNKRLTQINKS